MKPDWDTIVEAAEELNKKPSLHRIDGTRKDHQFKVYRCTGEILRIDIQPKKGAENG